MFGTNFIDEKISLEGKNVICVPVSFDLPITLSGAFASPFLNSIKYFFPSLLISNFNFSDRHLQLKHQLHEVHLKLYMSHDQTFHLHEVVS